MANNTGTSPIEPNPEKEGGTEKGDPQELLRNTEARAERETRNLFRELRKQFALGAAFQAGKKALEKGEDALKEFIERLTEN